MTEEDIEYSPLVETMLKHPNEVIKGIAVYSEDGELCFPFYFEVKVDTEGRSDYDQYGEIEVSESNYQSWIQAIQYCAGEISFSK